MDAYFYLTDKGEGRLSTLNTYPSSTPTKSLEASQDRIVLARLGHGPELYHELRDYLLSDWDLFTQESLVRASLRRLFEAGYVGFD